MNKAIFVPSDEIAEAWWLWSGVTLRRSSEPGERGDRTLCGEQAVEFTSARTQDVSQYDEATSHISACQPPTVRGKGHRDNCGNCGMGPINRINREMGVDRHSLQGGFGSRGVRLWVLERDEFLYI